MTYTMIFLFTFLALFAPKVALTATLPKTMSMSVPMQTQTTYYTCGPTSSMSVLKYFGKSKGNTEMSLAKQMGTLTSTGTRFWNLAKVLKQKGLIVKTYTKTSIARLKTALSKKEAVIINLNDDGGHYVVLAGFDTQYVYFMDPWYAYKTYTRWKISTFERQWYDHHDGVRYDRLGIFISKPML